MYESICLEGDTEVANTISKFYSGDSEKIFNKNISIIPDWYWYDVPISYEFNSKGYRMPQFDEVNWDNYFIALGCSNSVGVGLPLGVTYTGLLSDELNIDCVNLGLSGASNDFITMNFIHSIDKLPKKPKFVVVNWTKPYRFMWFKRTLDIEWIYNWVPSVSAWGKNKVPDFCRHEDYVSRSYANLSNHDLTYHNINSWKYKRKSIQLICSALEVGYVDFSMFSDFSEYCEYISIDNFDVNSYWARDIQTANLIDPTKCNGHVGRYHHKLAYEYTINQL